MAAHDDILPLVLVDAPGCPEQVAVLALNRAAAEFCSRSLVLQEYLDPVAVVPGEWRYELYLPARMTLAVLQSVRLDGRELTPVNDARGRRQWGEHHGPPTHYGLLTGWREIALDPTPQAAGELTLLAALAPALTATSLPDLVVNRHFEALIAGAMAHIKQMPNQAWSDPHGSQIALGRFRQLIDEARIENEYGRAIGSLRVTPRRFGG